MNTETKTLSCPNCGAPASSSASNCAYCNSEFVKIKEGFKILNPAAIMVKPADILKIYKTEPRPSTYPTLRRIWSESKPVFVSKRAETSRYCAAIGEKVLPVKTEQSYDTLLKYGLQPMDISAVYIDTTPGSALCSVMRYLIDKYDLGQFFIWQILDSQGVLEHSGVVDYPTYQEWIRDLKKAVDQALTEIK